MVKQAEPPTNYDAKIKESLWLAQSCEGWMYSDDNGYVKCIWFKDDDGWYYYVGNCCFYWFTTPNGKFGTLTQL